jgi:CRP-like cAMP-binding protein
VTLTLEHTPLFRGIDPVVVSDMTAGLTLCDFASGDVIVARDDPAAALYLLVDGKVKLGRCADDGRENLLMVLAPPDMFGELSVLDPGPQPWNATAVTDVRAIAVDRTQLLAWIDEHPVIAERLLRLLAKQLLGLAQRFGIPENGAMRVRHDLTQEELAQLVGATRETVNKALSDFRDRGWLRVDGKSVLISDSERLARRAH